MKKPITPEDIRFLRGMWDVLTEKVQTLLPDYQATITAIMTSQEAHDGHCGELLKEAEDTLNKELLACWTTYAKAYPAHYVRVCDYLRASRKTLQVSLLYAAHDMMHAFYLNPQDPLYQEESYQALLKGAHTLQKLPQETAARLWQSVVTLAIKGHDVYCFDEELQIFYSLTPDDNYYHYHSYDLYGHTLADMLSRLPDQAKELSSYPVRADIPQRYLVNSLEDLPEIVGRVRGIYG